jgi:hypothetical protein
MNSLAKYYASTNFKVLYPCAKVCAALQDLHSLVLLGSVDAIVIPSSGANDSSNSKRDGQSAVSAVAFVLRPIKI